ncbi:MAG: HEAT repeat domain-containing protein, partial [Planctomycetia bacterium]|nr:HEAT repeat domain-containing protein [Planctomycetia bacterium]
RAASVTALRLRDTSKALPYYLRALKNSVNIVVNRAADALAQLGTEAVIPQLIDALVTRHVYVELVPDIAPGISTNGNMVPVGQVVLPPSIEALLATGQLPYGVRVEAPASNVRMKEITYEKDEENQSVLVALTALTSEDFGYDEPAWKRWYSAQKNTAVGKKRKVRP